MKTFSCHRFIVQGRDLGIKFDSHNRTIIFANKYFTPSQWDGQFNDTVCSVNQVHSDIITEAHHNKKRIADGLYTNQLFTTLAIRTADCVPIMISSPTRIWALHCGWRGLASDILKSVLHFHSLDKSTLHFFIGPHIQKNQYEVDSFVIQNLAGNLKEKKSEFYQKKQNGNFWLCLSSFIKIRLQEEGILSNQLYFSNIDTYDNPDFFSYRQNKTTGRQWSFIQKN